MRLTDHAGQPIVDAAAASGLLTITFADGQTVTVARAELLDPITLH